MAHPVIVVGTYDNRHRAELDYEAEVYAWVLAALGVPV